MPFFSILYNQGAIRFFHQLMSVAYFSLFNMLSFMFRIAKLRLGFLKKVLLAAKRKTENEKIMPFYSSVQFAWSETQNIGRWGKICIFSICNNIKRNIN